MSKRKILSVAENQKTYSDLAFAFSKQQGDVNSAVFIPVFKVNVIGFMEQVRMKQNRSIFSVGNCDSLSIAEKFLDLSAHGWVVFFGIVISPIPIKGLLFGIDNQAAMLG